MLGLFGTLNLGTRSLQTQRAGVEVAGQNLANVNNPDYARQRVMVTTSLTLPTSFGPQGTGADVVGIQQIRNLLLDQQINSELSINGYLSAQQNALEYSQAGMGDVIDRAGSTSAVDSQTGFSNDLNELFAAFQNVSGSPSSVTERQLLLTAGQDVATGLNQTSQRLASVNGTLNTSVQDDVTNANKLMSEIASLNERIVRSETGGSKANDLRDLRESRLEELSKLIDVDATEDANGALSIAIGGNQYVGGTKVLDSLETFDSGGGQLLVRSASTQAPIESGSGHIFGTIDTRDGALATLRKRLDSMAGALVAEVNAVHQAGFGLNGTTGADFFTGTDAATIAVNGALLSDPARIQAAGVSGSPGDNTVMLALAQQREKKIGTLNNKTFADHYGASVTDVGQALSSTKGKLQDQGVVQKFLLAQRESFSGVSIDEEMTDLTRFQKAFEASAKLISTVDEMLETLLTLKR